MRIRALPDHLPQSIEYSIESLADFETDLHVSDLTIPADVTLLTDADEVVAKVQAPRVEEVAEPVATEGEEAAEGEGEEGAEPSDGSAAPGDGDSGSGSGSDGRLNPTWAPASSENGAQRRTRSGLASSSARA